MGFKLPQEEDTIAAIATPVGEGGVGIVKISGRGSLRIARRIFQARKLLEEYQSHRLYHGWIRDPRTNDAVDEVLLSYMAAPHSYTREDVVEINCHSGYAILSRVLDLALQAGARLAQPGEFTRRAFLNGRIDLSQAEAVIEVIRSQSQKSLEVASRNLKGELKQVIESIQEKLIAIQSAIEASIDFSDDLDAESSPDVHELAGRIQGECLAPIEAILENYRTGRVLREGLTLVLVGKPNVGKSSLLNALLGKDRAIVTSHPGTTRDVIEDSFILSGIMVRILDTAGIRREPDAIESIGIERTLQSIAEADVALWLIDRSRPLTDEDIRVYQAIGSSSYIILLNKADLPLAIEPDEVRQRFGDSAPILSLSALEASDVDRLRKFIAETFLKSPLERCQSAVVPNLRQKGCLDEAVGSLRQARELLLSGGNGELASIELTAARQQLAAILGWGGDADLLDHIFSSFCIGK